MKQIDESDVVPRNVLEEAGFRTRGATMYRILHHEEIRYVEITEQMFAYEGRFPVQRELNRSEVEE